MEKVSILKLKKINIFFVFLMIFIVVLDPANQIFKLKQVLLFLSLIAPVFLLLKRIPIKKEYVLVILFYFILPNFYSATTGLIFADFTNFSKEHYMTYLFGSFFGFFLLALNYINKKKLLKIFLIVLAIYSCLYFLLIVSFNLRLINYNASLVVNNLNRDIYSFLYNKGVLMANIKQIGNYKIINLFYKTCPILVLYFSYLLYHKKFFSIIVATILLISGTSANILGTLLVISFYFLSRVLKKIDTNSRILIFAVTTILFFFVSKELFFSSTKDGNIIKVGHILGYLKLWSEGIEKFILGSGLGSGFYTFGLEKVVYNAEVTYFEIIRLYGIVIGSIIILILFYPLIKLIKNKEMEWLFIGYVAYLFIGGTNPLILGSTGAVVVMITYRLSSK